MTFDGCSCDGSAATTGPAVGLNKSAVFGAPAGAIGYPNFHVMADANHCSKQVELADHGSMLHINCVAAERRPEQITSPPWADNQIGFALSKAVSPIAVENNIDALARCRSLPATGHCKPVNS